MKCNQCNGLSKRWLKGIVCSVILLFSVTIEAELEISHVLLISIENKYGQAAALRLQEWQTMIRTAKQLPELEKLKVVNDFFNQRIEFVDDIDLWGLADYWATPLELLARGAGDCEDYSIAKYFTLKELGVAESKMRITYVKALRLNQAHMVLTYFTSTRSVPLVLDNLIAAIEPASDRSDLLPVYSFNGVGLWLAKSRGTGKYVGDSGDLNRWSELKKRMLSGEF